MTEFSGMVITGDGIGKTMGFPTLNIDTPHIPDETGVFAVQVQFLHEDALLKGIMHLGPRPTLEKAEKRVEIFLLHFSGSVSPNAAVTVTVGEKIREVQKFDSLESLKQQITKDVEAVEKYFG